VQENLGNSQRQPIPGVLPLPFPRHVIGQVLSHSIKLERCKPKLPYFSAAPYDLKSCAANASVEVKTTFEVFTRVGPDNSLERLTERSVGLVTDRPSDVYQLLVVLFE
jgi:hypothetical protein